MAASLKCCRRPRFPLGGGVQAISGSNQPLIAASSGCRSTDRQRSAPLQAVIVRRPILGLVLRRGPTAHPNQLSRWIHAVNPTNQFAQQSQSGAFLLFGHEAALPYAGQVRIEIDRVTIKNKARILSQLNHLNITQRPSIRASTRRRFICEISTNPRNHSKLLPTLRPSILHKFDRAVFRPLASRAPLFLEKQCRCPLYLAWSRVNAAAAACQMSTIDYRLSTALHNRFAIAENVRSPPPLRRTVCL
jgi:hypothetical protein